MSSAAAVSAPGKVFLAGGYLVLDRAYTALVFGLSARIHVVVRPLPAGKPGTVSVYSPQFQDAEWHYSCKTGEDGRGVEVAQVTQTDEAPSRNKFVETTLAYTLSYAAARGAAAAIPAASVHILADDDYYSHANTSTACVANPASRFCSFNVRLTDAHKTGLGSSAALVTALAAALLSFYLPSEGPPPKVQVHNLAQAAHCAAQGKIGSGFDVAAAVYGSCIYRRFSPAVLERIGEAHEPGFAAQLAEVIDDADSAIWDASVAPSAVTLPKALRLVMCDVDCGSETPGLVRRVFAWRAAEPDAAKRLWDTLQGVNEALAAELQALAAEPGRSYEQLGATVQKMRGLLRDMSQRAGVPIEPPVQTALLDACTLQPGVVGGVVPGAGGYDAITLLVEDKPEVLEALGKFVEGYKAEVKDDVTIGRVRLLGVKEEFEGFRVEGLDTYRGWLEA